MADLRLFAHPPLDRSLKQIRLLRVQGGGARGPVRCVLKTYNISDAKDYIALSYTWGPEFPQRQIYINGAEFFIRQNLFDFLTVARGQLPGSLFWIDQICIDQVDFRERSHQVSLMSSIYKDALYVIAWLGKEGDGSDMAIAYMKESHKAPIWAQKSTVDGTLTWSTNYDKETSLKVRDSLVTLFARRYWRRLWIIQEVVLARRIVLFCGSLELNWPDVERFVVDMHRMHIPGIVSTHVTKLFYINKPLVYSGEKQQTATSARSFLLEPWISPEGGSKDAFRASIYRCCDFECSDPRDKIYGLLGISRGRENGVEADYGKSTITVFWDFFTSHIDGIEHIRDDGTGRPVQLPIEEVLDDWWHFAIRIMSSMGIDQPGLRKQVITLLIVTFEVLQRDWLSKGLLKEGEQQDISKFFAGKLQSEDARGSEDSKERFPDTERSEITVNQGDNSIVDEYVDPFEFLMY